jgi:hypothetical protein
LEQFENIGGERERSFIKACASFPARSRRTGLLRAARANA